MAKASTPKTSTTGQLNTWEAELAKSAVIAAKAEAKSADRPFISMNGMMSLDGARFPNDTAAVIVLDNLLTNLYYPGTYDPSNPVPPDCYAYGRSDEDGNIVGVDTWDGRTEMAPHKDCASKAHTDCASCPLNAFKSAANGKGKACQNTRRIGMIPAGAFVDGKFQPFTKAEQVTEAPMAYLKLAVMSGKGFAAYVKQTATGLQKPLWGVFSRLTRVVSGAQYVAQFEPLGIIPNNLMEAVYKRMLEVKEDITFPFQPKSAEPAGAAKKPAGKRKYT